MKDHGRDNDEQEIDLFEIVEILWQGKWIIVTSMFLALALAYAYTTNQETVYEYNVPYSSITAPNASVFKHFLTRSDMAFSLNTKSKKLSLTSTNPSYEAVISAEAGMIGNKYTQYQSQSLIDQANFTLKLINEDIPVQILNSEEVAKRYFEAKLMLQKVTNGASKIVFQPVVKTVKSPKVRLVLALSLVLGGMLGLFFIVFFRVVAAYKNRQPAEE